MFARVKIGAREVEMVANGATVYRYKQIFREDYFRAINESDGIMNLEIFSRLGFVMAMQAAKKDMAKLNEEDFYEWLGGFEPFEVQGAVDKIADVFNGSSKGTADPKEEPAP